MILLAVPARADMTHIVSEADSLTIAQPCARSVTILTDAILTRQVVLDAAADHPEETAQLTVSGAPATVLHAAGPDCTRVAGGDAPTLDITVRVPIGLPVSINEPGRATYDVGATEGPLTIAASGDISLAARRVGTLNVASSGTGRFAIARVEGPVRLTLSGSGTVAIGAGTADPLTLQNTGAVDVTMDGVVTGGVASLSGSGSLSIARLTGTLDQSASGTGTVTIRER